VKLVKPFLLMRQLQGKIKQKLFISDNSHSYSIKDGGLQRKVSSDVICAAETE
jgi:hypothetical protein